MRRAWFIGGGAHTALGTDPVAAVGALEQISEPERVPLQYGDTLDEIPYRLLAGRPLERLEERLYDVLAGVIERALDEAAISADERLRMGLFLGSSSADVSVSEARFRRELAESDDAIALIASNSIANLALHLRRRFGLRGPDYSFNTACTASANALVTASDMIARGRIENALVVGVELFNVVTAAGFQSLGLLAPGNMRPFDRDRDGLTPGEGCSALVLSARQRSSDDLYLRGSATLCDTYSMSTTNPDGSTVATVIERALERAGVPAAGIAAIKVHGTASLHSDEAEAAGMQAVFDAVPPIFALKPHLGHTLGACGLNELLLFRAAAAQGVLPGTPGIASADRSDSGLALNQHNRDIAPGHFMLNYFGFGGNNTSLIVSNVD
jgi:3-oxoacyl-[acyl-carrier-protein] synthase-1